MARVWGVVEPKTGTIDLPLIVDWPNRPLQKVDHENGKAAVTEWRVLKQQGETSRVRLTPKTGRSHQLRVHMLALGHPILGDPLYAPETCADHPRMMLHAQNLRVRHPDGGQGTSITAPCVPWPNSAATSWIRASGSMDSICQGASSRSRSRRQRIESRIRITR